MNTNVKTQWQNALTRIGTTILEAIQKIDENGLRVLLVVDESKKLLGTVTDGDIRRLLLKQMSLHGTIESIMNKKPITASLSESQDQLLIKMRSLGILHLPILDDDGKVIGLETFASIYEKNTRDNWVIFMAGGMGKRLHPLTIDCPKPLLKIADKPIAEILLENFIKSGFRNFYFSVNYKANMIRDYFGSGARWGVNIKYIEENETLGTAGSLSLLSERPDKPFFVINSDILTNINFGYLLDFHIDHERIAHATLCVRQHQHTVPFGVVKINPANHCLLEMTEKPTQHYFINAGIYILDPDVLKLLPFNTYSDMPQFLMNLVSHKMNVTTYPIREYWLDIGHHDNLIRAASDYSEMLI